MDANKIRQLSIQNDPTRTRLKKIISKMYKMILKAARKGRYKIRIAKRPKWLLKSAINSDEYYDIMSDHFNPSGFLVESSADYIHVSWYPHAGTFRVCEVGEELKHLILTGKAPDIVIGDEK